MILSQEEQQIFLDGVAQFAQQQVIPETTPYETPMDGQTLIRLANELEALGIIAPLEEVPLGLWADVAETSTLNLDLLRLIGKANAALALVIQRKALTHWLLRATGLATNGTDIALTLTGHYGLARSSLGKWLNGHSRLADEDTVLLSDWLDRQRHGSTLWTTAHCKQVLWPLWKGDNIQWQLIDKGQLDINSEIAHGLNELDFFTAINSSAATGITTNLAREDSRKLYKNLLKMELLGLTAIGLGVLDRSSELAIEFAAMRVQGGTKIQEHAAVQIMLSEIRSTIKQVTHTLRGLQGSIDHIPVSDAAAIRLNSSDLLVHACHQVIQIHGGMGYMRDTGPEKYVRDQNMLRLASGGVSSLLLLIHGVES